MRGCYGAKWGLIRQFEGLKINPSGTVLQENATSPVLHVKIRSFLHLKKGRVTDNPHRRAPDVYFKTIWISKPLYEGFQYISDLKEQSIRKTTDELMAQTIKDFIVKLVRDAARYEVELNELYRRGISEKNVRLWIALLRKVLADRAASGT